MKLQEMIDFDKSIGYDCKKMNNLCLIEPNTLTFASGNLLHFFHIDSGHMRTQPSVGRQGISFITKNPNPNYNYLTVAECGTKPIIFILNYPAMSIVSTCANGADQSYACVSYNATGELMASQGAAPDFTLTIWNWRSSSIIFRKQSADLDVLNVRFSVHNSEQLVTGGVTHIKFWTMCRTFTGLKLTTVPGRFGHADVCNVMGLCAMPDRKILSNSAWGSILVWNTDGHIKFEVCQKNHKPCHRADISQIVYDGGDVMTVGQDGYVRFWFWKTVDLADPIEGQPFVEVDPTFEYFVGSAEHTCQLLSMVRGPEDRCWFAQDGNGGIWKCDFRSVYDGKCEMLFRCHAGGVIGLACSPYTAHMVTLGLDGRAHLYDYEGGRVLGYHQFPAGGRDLLWIPREVDASGAVIIAAFEDGVIRVFCVNVLEHSFHVIQSIKSHSDAVNRILLSIGESILVSGSNDHTIFVHKIVQRSPYIRLMPIGLIGMTSAVTALAWHHQKMSAVLVGCANGDLIEVIVPTQIKSYDDVTYVLSHIEQRKYQLALPKTICADDECDSKAPGRILWLEETPSGKIHVSMAGDYAGYILEYDLEDEATLIAPVLIEENIELSCVLKLFGFVILGLSNGKMVLRATSDTYSDDYTVNLHNNLYGRITSLGVSFDRRFLISVGLDGNIFIFRLHPSIGNHIDEQLPNDFIEPLETVDIMDAKHLSLEEEKKQSYRDERVHLINNKKSQMLEVLAMLKEDFGSIKSRNASLPECERITTAELELDDRITQDLESGFDDEMNLMRRKMAFDVEKSKLLKDKVENLMTNNLECWPFTVRGIRTDASVETFRIAKTSDEFLAIKAGLDEQIASSTEVRNSICGQNANRLMDIIESSSSEERDASSKESDTVLQHLLASTDDTKFDLQMKRLLKKYTERKCEEAERSKMWQYIKTMVPDPNVLDANDVQALQTAKETIGNYCLKTDPDFVPTEDDVATAAKKFKQLLNVKEEIHRLRSAYNEKIFRVRQKRILVCKFIDQQSVILMRIQEEIPHVKVERIDRIPAMSVDTGIPAAILSRAASYTAAEAVITEEHHDACSYTHIVVDALGNYQPVMGKCDPLAHSWEKEFLSVRLTEKLFQQSRVIAEVRNGIDAFDNEIIELQKARLDVDLKTKFLEAHFLMLYQELWILKDFEQVESEMLEKIASDLGKCEDIKLEYLCEKAKVEASLGYIKEFKEEIHDMRSLLERECAGSKHENYLMSIFRENSDAQQPLSTDDCDSTADSIGSFSDADVQLIESVKSMCQKRLTIEKGVKQETIVVDRAQDRMNQLKDTLDAIEIDLRNHNDELKRLTLEKQNMLNNVETLAIVRFDQMQYFTNGSELYEIEDTLVVNHDTISKLFQRVGQLGMETIDEQRKHRIYKMHLARLKTDCNFMTSQILHLKDKTNSIMLKRFGAIIDLDEMEESILKKFLLNAQGNAEAIDREYQRKAIEVKKSIVQKEVEFLKAKQERIEKMHVLTALQEERNMLEEAIGYQNKIEARLVAVPPADFGHDLTKLKEICQQQQDQLKILKKEIQTLRMKAKPFEPHPLSAMQHPIDFPYKLYDQHSIDDGTRASSTSSSLSRVTNAADDINSIRKITVIVERFLGKCIAMHMDATTLAQHAKKISHYLAQVIANYDVQNVDDVTRCVAENLKGFLPKRALRYIHTRDLALLFNEVVQMFADDDDNFTIDDLMENIVAELKAKVPRGSPGYSDSFVCEFLEDVFAVLPLEEVNRGNRVREVAAALRKAADLDRTQIDATKIAAEVSAYFGSSIGNNMNTKDLKRFIDDLVSNLSENSSVESKKKTQL